MNMNMNYFIYLQTQSHVGYTKKFLSSDIGPSEILPYTLELSKCNANLYHQQKISQ